MLLGLLSLVYLVGQSIGRIGRLLSQSISSLICLLFPRSAPWVGWSLVPFIPRSGAPSVSLSVLSLVGPSVGWSVSQSVGALVDWFFCWCISSLVGPLIGTLVSQSIDLSFIIPWVSLGWLVVGWSVPWLGSAVGRFWVLCWSVSRLVYASVGCFFGWSVGVFLC